MLEMENSGKLKWCKLLSSDIKILAEFTRLIDNKEKMNRKAQCPPKMVLGGQV